MPVSILFFGATAQLVGHRRIESRVTPESTVRSTVEDVFAKFPQLRDGRYLYALNEKYVTLDADVTDGDELAIFTPVSGG